MTCLPKSLALLAATALITVAAANASYAAPQAPTGAASSTPPRAA